jgi:hypothetical protein
MLCDVLAAEQVVLLAGQGARLMMACCSYLYLLISAYRCSTRDTADRRRTEQQHTRSGTV